MSPTTAAPTPIICAAAAGGRVRISARTLHTTPGRLADLAAIEVAGRGRHGVLKVHAQAGRRTQAGMLAYSRACKAGPATACPGPLEGRRLLDEDLVREGRVGCDAVLPPPPPHQEVPAAAAPVRPALPRSCHEALSAVCCVLAAVCFHRYQPCAVRAAWLFSERRPGAATAAAGARGRLCRRAAGLVGSGAGAGVIGILLEGARREADNGAHKFIEQAHCHRHRPRPRRPGPRCLRQCCLHRWPPAVAAAHAAWRAPQGAIRHRHSLQALRTTSAPFCSRGGRSWWLPGNLGTSITLCCQACLQ